MTFNYSYEECSACEYLLGSSSNGTLFVFNCDFYGCDVEVKLSTNINANCKHFKPKEEVKMGKKLTDFSLEQMNNNRFRRKDWAINKDIVFHYCNTPDTHILIGVRDLIADDWEIVPEKKKVTIYVFRDLKVRSNIMVSKLPQDKDFWELLETIEKEYEV